MSIFTWKFWTISLYCASQRSNQRNYKKEDNSTYENNTEQLLNVKGWH